MNSVTVGGVTYTKLSVLAKKYGYTTDYLGQLCRADKVEAELVGRAWYANEASLKAHKSERYQASGIDENNAVTRSDSDSVRYNVPIRVQPRFSKRTHKHFADQEARRNFAATHLRVTYGADEADLTPSPKKSSRNDTVDSSSDPTLSHESHLQAKADSSSHVISVRDSTVPRPAKMIKNSVPEKSVKLKISQESRDFDLSFTDMPSVALRGPIKIKDLESEDYVSQSVDTPLTKPPRRVVPKLPHQSRVKVQDLSKAPTKTSAAEQSVAMSAHPHKTTTPSSAPTPVRSARISYAVPIGATVALVCAGLLLFTGSTYEVEGQSVASSWYLQVASLRDIFTLLRGG